MKKYLSINQNRDFQRIYARGKFFVSPVLVSYVMKSRRGSSIRVGITTSKKTGNAVKRNRSRRVIREAFRAVQTEIRPGYDLVFVARAKTPFVKTCDVQRAMEQHLKNAGLLQ